jgi:O-antigen ligase
MAIYEGDTSGRDVLFSNAIKAFLDSPIIGKQFALFGPGGTFVYSHNIILDAFMGLGIFGGIAIIYFLTIAFKNAYKLIKINDNTIWINLILIQLIVSNLVSGAFYYDQLLSMLLVFQFMYFRKIKLQYKNL